MSEEPEIIPETEALAPPPAETVETETPETTEETAEAETPEAEETTEESERPKRESGYARMKRRALIAEAQLANARVKENLGTKADDSKAPKEEDFNGDWGKYIAKTAGYEAVEGVKAQLAADRNAAQQARAEQLNQEVLQDFNERADAFKSKAKDFDDVVEEFVSKGGKFSDPVRELVMDSDLGPQLTYHLAKNPALANKLNALPPLQAAKEVGRIEDTLSKPSKPTKAVAPVTPVKGGSSGNFDPASASMDEYVAKRKAGWKG